MKSFGFFSKLAFAAGFVFATSHATAAGYEKNIVLGGKAAALGGIATSYTDGAEALYFNPAGLIGKAGREVSFDFSPTWSTFKGPIDNQNTQLTSAQSLSPIFGLLYSNTINDDWAYGFGGYISGGARAKYDGITLSGFANPVNVNTDLIISEIAAGVGYKVSDSLKLGLAWRYVMAQAGFAVVNRVSGGAVVANTELSDLKDTEAAAFKLGLQYKLDDKANMSLVYRSEVNLEAAGNQTQKSYTSAAQVASTTNSATAKTTFPMAVTLGYDRQLSDTWSLFTEYVWTQYSRVKNIDIVTPSGTTQVQQEWKDQHNVRLAGEYRGWSIPARFGYVLTTQVSNGDFPRASFTPPSIAHSLTFGSGYSMMDNKMALDWGIEYTFGGIDAGTAHVGNTTSDYRAGNYAVSAYALHLGLKYAL